MTQSLPQQDTAILPALHFDRASGIGACDLTRQRHHMAEVVLMRPQQFLSLTPRLDSSSDPRIGTLLQDIWAENAFCPPTLTLAPEQAYQMGGMWQTGGQWAVVSHDGRHRATAIMTAARIAGIKPPLIPVLVFGQSGQDMLPMDRDMLRAANQALIPQGQLKPIAGPFFQPSFTLPEEVAFSGSAAPAVAALPACSAL